MKVRSFTMLVLLLGLSLPLTLVSAAQQPRQPLLQADVGFYNVELVRQIGGTIEAIAVQDSYAYVGIGHRLVVFDVSSPATPRVVGKTPPFPDVVTSIAISGSYAFVTAYDLGGLRVIDISNPTNPIEVGTYIPAPIPPWFPTCYDVAVFGSYAYLAAGEYGVYVLDVSNVATPVEVAHYEASGLAARHVVHSAGYLYITSNSGDRGQGLHIIDVANPLNPSKVGFYGISHPGGMGLRGLHVYVTESHDGGGALRVIDVSQPNNPVEVSQVPLAAAGDVAISDSFAYVAVGWAGLQVVNISNPATLTVVGSLSTSKYSRHVAASGSHVYLTHDFADLRIIDTSNPAMPTEVGYYKTPGFVYDVAISDHYVYIVGTEGLHVFDITHSASLVEVGYLSVYYHRLDISGSYAYATSEGLRVIDISNPAQPTEVGSWSGSARDVAVTGDYAYVADESNGLRVISVANPTHPIEVGSYDTPGWATGVAVVGDYAYVSDSDSLRIIDVADPVHPSEVGFVDTHGSAWDVAVSGPYAYVATTCSQLICGSVLEVIDISDPAHPTLVGYSRGGGWGIAISGSCAYSAEATEGLRIVDVSDPSNPTEVGLYKTPGLAYQVAVSDKYVYVANEADGLIILWFSPPTTATIPTTGGSLTSLADQTIYVFPAGTFTDTTIITHTARFPGNAPSGGNLINIGHFFDVTANRSDTGQPAHATKPYTITVQYTEADKGPAIEDTLGLYWWDEGVGQWSQQGITSSVNITDNLVNAQVDHFSLFAVLGETRRVFLPVVLRNY